MNPLRSCPSAPLSPDDAKLTRLAADPRVQALRMCERLRFACSVLAAVDPVGFATVDNLTWPEGQGLLLSSSEERLRASRQTPVVKRLFKAPYVIHTGLDRPATGRFVELLMQRLGYAPGTINQVKAMVTADARRESFETILRYA